MTERTWISRHNFQKFLIELGCRLDPDSDPANITVFNPKSMKVAVMPNSGYMPPEAFWATLNDLDLYKDAVRLLREIKESHTKGKS